MENAFKPDAQSIRKGIAFVENQLRALRESGDLLIALRVCAHGAKRAMYTRGITALALARHDREEKLKEYDAMLARTLAETNAQG